MKYCKREVYAVETGDYVGKMFAVVDPKKEAIGCLILPQMENIHVPIESFDNGRNNDIIKLVEKLPKKTKTHTDYQVSNFHIYFTLNAVSSVSYTHRTLPTKA